MVCAIVPIYFSSRFLLAVAVGILAIIFFVVVWRRLRGFGILLGMGLSLIALAAGGPVWVHLDVGSVTVMVDLSPSTRGAVWRNRSALEARVGQILGDTPYQVIAFAEFNQALRRGEELGDMPAERTVFSPPPSGVVLLFSDGQFELPAVAPRTFAVIDPGLDRPGDGRVS